MTLINDPPARKTKNSSGKFTTRQGKVNIWTYVGLTLVLISEPVLMSSPVRLLFQASGSISIFYLLNAASILMILTAVLCCLVFGERASLRSIGFRRLQFSLIMTGVAYGLALLTFWISAIWILTFFHMNVFEGKISDAGVPNLPYSVGLIVSLVTGFAVETLYRGYAICRLSLILKNQWFAATVVFAAGVVTRAPFWPPPMLASQMVLGLFFTILFMSKRDLTLNIIAHISVLLTLDILPFLI